jgi:hypothetical protein
VTATAAARLLATDSSRLLVPSPIAASWSTFRHSSLTPESRLLVVADAMGNSTWRAGTATLWNASVVDTASIYFLDTHGKTNLCKFDPNIEDLLIFMKN